MTDAAATPAVVLFVDLDGTLIKTDSLHESLLALLRDRPSALLNLPLWLGKGKAAFKSRVAAALDADPLGELPLNDEVLRLIEAADGCYEEVVLATAADESVARTVATRLGCFHHVLASDGDTNLSGHRKRDAIREYAAGRPYDYAGDAPIDLPAWANARRAYVVGRKSLANRVTGADEVVHIKRQGSGTFRAWARQLRVHQWCKNLLLAVPLVMAHRVTDWQALGRLGLAMLAFSLTASAVYLVNDLVDLRGDRRHPKKRRRPLAAGDLSIGGAVAAAPGLLVTAGVIAAAALPVTFLIMLAAYFVLSLVYSLWLKRKAVVDVLVLSVFYVYRVLIGAVAVGVVCSPWLLAYCLFFFFSLASLKRFAEIGLFQGRGEDLPPGRPYRVGDAPLLQTFGVVSAVVSVLVIALYLQSETVESLYRRPEWLWLMCPVMLAWSMHAWLTATRGEMDDDPVLFAVRDRWSYAVLVAVVTLLTVAT